MTEKPSLEEVLALDVLCLTEPDGGPLDRDRHREALEKSVPHSEWALVRRAETLLAYGYLWPLGGDTWFVGGLAIHPAHRNAAVTAALGQAMAGLLRRLGVRHIESHVRKGNSQSMRLHRRLGFAVKGENDLAVAFAADSEALLKRLPV
jgi:RimJ/RimL family protein N-acetyltransferase